MDSELQRTLELKKMDKSALLLSKANNIITTLK
jgi:hypothetical protein